MPALGHYRRKLPNGGDDVRFDVEARIVGSSSAEPSARLGLAMTDLDEAALELAGAGWRVVPCQPRGKRPVTVHGTKDATTDLAQVEWWWRRWRQANIAGIVPDGLVGLNIDPRNDAERSLRVLEHEHGPLPITLTVRTGGGGEHRYFRHPGGELRSTVHALGPGLEVKVGGSGTLMLPPSIHAAGRRYEWVDPNCSPAPLPSWLAAWLRPPPLRPPPPRVDRPRCTDRYGAVALEREAEDVAAAPAGMRNHRLNVAAFSLGQLVGGGVLDPGVVAEVLVKAARAAGLGEQEAVRTCASGLRAGLANPRSVA
ncbi:hypothetical protein BH18ACT1_BH18ACT1_00250 [soil metagenome]